MYKKLRLCTAHVVVSFCIIVTRVHTAGVAGSGGRRGGSWGRGQRERSGNYAAPGTRGSRLEYVQRVLVVSYYNIYSAAAVRIVSY